MEEPFWLKILLTLGEVPGAVVDTKNNLDAARTMDKRGVLPGRAADVTVTGNYLSRAHRASTPVPEDYVKPKRLREQALSRVTMLEDMMNIGTDVPAQSLEAARQMLREAEETSLRTQFEFKSYWHGWVNSFPSTQASLFEMVLSFVLLHHYLGSKDDVNDVMRKREGAEPTEEGGKGGRRGGKGKGK